MEQVICTTCGAYYAETPNACTICTDERQYVNAKGQSWKTLLDAQKQHQVVIKPKETHLYGIGIEPRLAIGQRALLVQTPKGNLLWDCIPLIDAESIKLIQKLGGIDMIAISHPHYYTALSEWSRAFGNIPVYLHEDDKEWVTNPDTNIKFWRGDTLSLLDELTVIRLGGHFKGGSVLHWPAGAEGKGVLLTGDIIQWVPDTRFVSFMYSYPNLIPLSKGAVETIWQGVSELSFDRIYSAWWGSCVETDAKNAVERSKDRYIQAIML